VAKSSEAVGSIVFEAISNGEYNTIKAVIATQVAVTCFAIDINE